jgi:hypothetical protein
MSDFQPNIDDLSDSKSITSLVKDSFYPDNQQIVKNTSFSEENNFDRTLMSRDVMRVMQGDGLHRNPAFSLAGYEQNTKSTMHTILSMGADIDESVSIADPDDPTGESKLTGSQARIEIARKSVMTTGFAPTGFESAMQSFISSATSDVVTGTTGQSDNQGSVQTETGSVVPHSLKGYTTTSGSMSYNGGTRAIALVDELTAEEIKEYNRRADLLSKKTNWKGSAQAIKDGFYIDFNTNKEGQNLKNLGFDITFSVVFRGSGENAKDKYRSKRLPIDKDLLGSGKRKTMVAAVLVELIDRLTDSLIINTDFGAARGIVGANFAALTAEKNSVSDHSFGRAIDLFSVGTSSSNMVNFGSNPPAATYLKGLNMLLSYIENLPQSLHPDLIVISDQLANQLGITESLEEGNAPIRKLHPRLAGHVNFHNDSRHRNHVHLSFGPDRAGSILSASVLTAQQQQQSPGTPGGSGGAGVAPAIAERLKKIYYAGDGVLTDVEVFTLLNDFGNYGEEVSALFTALSWRESRWKPWAINKHGFVGLWQLGTRTGGAGGQASGGGNKVKLVIPQEQIIEMWKLGYREWQAAGLNAKNCDPFIRNKQYNDPAGKNGLQFWDRRAFCPLNQIYMLRGKFGQYDTIKPVNGLSKGLISPWGETFLYHGWLSGVSFQKAADAYTKCTGKSRDVLANWVIANYPKNVRSAGTDPITGKAIVRSWIEGKSYGIIYSQDGAYAQPSGWPSRPPVGSVN